MKLLPFLILLAAFKLHAQDLSECRQLYYKSVKEEEFVEKAIDSFEKWQKSNPKSEGLCNTYLGSLIALKAKYAFWPQTKYSLAIEGIEKMELGVKQDPTNVESLFIYGSTCYYLPFFFSKKDDSINALKKIITLLSNGQKSEPKLVRNALKFIDENLDLNSVEKSQVKKILSELPS